MSAVTLSRKDREAIRRVLRKRMAADIAGWREWDRASDARTEPVRRFARRVRGERE